MAEIALITGGCRSGKSRQARELGEALTGPRLFAATAMPVDAEMKVRIQRHRLDRPGGMWETVEEPVELAAVLGERPHPVVLVDCLTLWISNLMLALDRTGMSLDEEILGQRCADLLAVCAARRGTVLFVTNEVGMGVVPDSELGRRFRDLVGRANQVFAQAADRVVMMVSGMALELKGNRDAAAR